MRRIQKTIDFIDTINEKIGTASAWLILPLVFAVFLSVILRYLFAEDVIWLQELSLYFHAFLFLTLAGYALKHGAHVRVDVFSQKFSSKTQALIEMAGTLLLLFPVFLLLLNDAFFFVLDSWLIFEGSQMTGGLPTLYIFKSFLLILPVVLLLQATSQFLKALLLFLDKEAGSQIPEDKENQGDSPASSPL